LLGQLDFIWRWIVSVDGEIAVIHAVSFSAAQHNCAKTEEKNRLHRVSIMSAMMRVIRLKSKPAFSRPVRGVSTPSQRSQHSAYWSIVLYSPSIWRPVVMIFSFKFL